MCVCVPPCRWWYKCTGPVGQMNQMALMKQNMILEAMRAGGDVSSLCAGPAGSEMIGLPRPAPCFATSSVGNQRSSALRIACLCRLGGMLGCSARCCSRPRKSTRRRWVWALSLVRFEPMRGHPSTTPMFCRLSNDAAAAQGMQEHGHACVAEPVLCATCWYAVPRCHLSACPRCAGECAALTQEDFTKSFKGQRQL